MRFLESNGRSKVLFGTNWPQLDFARCVGECNDLSLSEDTLRALLGDNAVRVFQLEDLCHE